MSQSLKPLTRRARFVFGLTLLLLFFAATSLVVSVLPQNSAGTIVLFILGVAITPLLASPYEWIIHRFLYHRKSVATFNKIYRVHTAHHHLYFPPQRFIGDGHPQSIPLWGRSIARPYTSAAGNALVYVVHFCFYLALAIFLIWLPAWLTTRNPYFLAGVMTATILICNLFIVVHDAIHYPGRHPLMENRRWFKFLEKHHYIHHIDTEANVNFLLPVADWLFGTLRQSLTEQERLRHRSWEEIQIDKRKEEGAVNLLPVRRA